VTLLRRPPFRQVSNDDVYEGKRVVLISPASET